MMASRYADAKQFKRHHRQLRLLRSQLGRIIRDIHRKITGRPELEAVFEAPIARAAQIRSATAAPAWMGALFLSRPRGRTALVAIAFDDLSRMWPRSNQTVVAD
jgi:hypothetical protein